MFSTSTAISATASMPKQRTTKGARRFLGADRTSDNGRARLAARARKPGLQPLDI